MRPDTVDFTETGAAEDLEIVPEDESMISENNLNPASTAIVSAETGSQISIPSENFLDLD